MKEKRKEIIAGDVLIINQNNNNDIVVVIAEVPDKYFITVKCVVKAYQSETDNKTFKNVNIYNSKYTIRIVSKNEIVDLFGHVSLNEDHLGIVYKNIDPSLRDSLVYKTYGDIMNKAYENNDLEAFENQIHYIANNSHTYDITALRPTWISNLSKNKSEVMNKFGVNRQKVQYWINMLKKAEE